MTEELMPSPPSPSSPCAVPRFGLSKKIGIVFLALLLLGLGNILVVHAMFAEFTGFDETMRVAGKMRYLGHRMALNTSSFVNGWSPGKQAALSDIKSYEDSVSTLMHRGNTNSDQIRRMTPPQQLKLEEIRIAWQRYREDIESALLRGGTSRPDARQMGALAESSQSLLDDVDQLMVSLIKEMHREQEDELNIAYLLLVVDILFLGGMWLIVRLSFVRPVLRLAQGSRELANGNYQVHIEHRPNDEVGHLVDAFNDSARRIGTLIGNLEQEHLNLMRAESMFRGIAETSAVGVYIIQDHKFVFANTRLAQMFGVEQHRLLESLGMFDLVAEGDHDLLEANVPKRLHTDGRFEGLASEYQARRKDGSLFDLAVYGSGMFLDGRPAKIGIAMDITERKAAEEVIRKLAFYDRMTSLPNRRMMEDRLGQLIALAKREERKLSLLFIDLDKFKAVNDQHGHEAGDWLLAQVASRMGSVLRESDTASRIGGDEFVILLPDARNAEDAVVVAEKIRLVLEQPFVMENGVTLSISSSIGVVIYPDLADNLRDLLRYGDEAMYRAKKGGRNAVEVFTLLPLTEN
ncbi:MULTISPECIES: diguanylate cyclase [unclassified Pseudomonas]|uniref:diguanylate cyclase n=1 Tax=unclassified Pseudomonas TaxID=196821 RepID=UPI0009E71A19|nr:diguanylate cyclase [Pseudomonas sp. Leaf48]MBV7476593.1 diguanylate cyclase [Pseudomonas sp. PDM31]